MLAQNFRCRLRIERPPKTDDFGILGLTKEWEHVGTVWGFVDTAKSGSEAQAGRQLASVATHMVTIRFRDDIRPEFRFIWKDSALHVINISNHLEQDRYLEIQCRQENI